MTEKRPKILYVCGRMRGGVLTYMINLTGRLADRYDFVILYSTEHNTPKKFRAMFDPRVRLIRWTSYDPENNAIHDSSAKAEIKKAIEKEKPDIVHLHGYKAGQFGRKLLDGSTIPCFYTPHGYRYLAEDHNFLTRSLYRRNEASAAKTDAVTIACSRGEYAETLAFTDRAVYVNNGIDTDQISAIVSKMNVPQHPLTVFTVGEITEQKNPSTFNEIAMAMPQTRFTWIGDGMLKYRLTAPNIEVTGWKEREEALKLADEGDVFILTSLWEGLPLSLLEAMYMGKLCIVSNVVGSRDVIENGENGYICDSAAAFVNAINQYGSKEADQIAEKAHEDIAAHYNMEQMAAGYDKIYSEALLKK